MNRKIKCGDKVKDPITGFRGTVTQMTEFINGCIQCCVTPKIDRDGKYPESVDIDIQQLELITPKKTAPKKTVKKEVPPGGPSRINRVPINRRR